MNKQEKPTPDQKPEMFKLQKNYCYLTGYPVDRGVIKQTPVQQTTKITQKR